MPSVKVVSIWKVFAVAAGAVAVIGIARVVWIKAEGVVTPGTPVPTLPAPEVVMPKVEVPPGNPLLTASKEQLRQWFPSYCGADMFMRDNTPRGAVLRCADGVAGRVASATGVQLTRDDVLDPRVRQHWRATMGVD